MDTAYVLPRTPRSINALINDGRVWRCVVVVVDDTGGIEAVSIVWTAKSVAVYIRPEYSLSSHLASLGLNSTWHRSHHSTKLMLCCPLHQTTQILPSRSSERRPVHYVRWIDARSERPTAVVNRSADRVWLCPFVSAAEQLRPGPARLSAWSPSSRSTKDRRRESIMIYVSSAANTRHNSIADYEWRPMNTPTHRPTGHRPSADRVEDEPDPWPSGAGQGRAGSPIDRLDGETPVVVNDVEDNNRRDVIRHDRVDTGVTTLTTPTGLTGLTNDLGLQLNRFVQFQHHLHECVVCWVQRYEQTEYIGCRLSIDSGLPEVMAITIFSLSLSLSLSLSIYIYIYIYI